MANEFKVKNGLIVNSTQKLVSPDLSQAITLRMLDSGTLSFSGTSGQLFSITDSLTGTIFAVNDISGVPSIEVFDTGKIQLAETFGNVGVGTADPLAKLHVVSTSEALRVGYDATKYTKCSTDSNGNYSVQSTAGILQGSAVLSTSAVTQVALHTFALANFVSGEYIITAKQNSTVQITKILVVHDSSTASATEFGTVQTGSRLFTVEVDINSTNVRILITPTGATATSFKTQFTLFGA